ncbi:helix-turn-helix domain-containing protein [Parapedobacter sp. DT-150]|uniref:AraC family transcriptional regulator n=1 Tax=Parapedobacter sp. DT-150 TaxID=3396162 RepID=UPI003F1B0D4C
MHHGMKTPFTPLFEQAGIPLTRVERRPFIPTHAMPFVKGDAAAQYAGGRCRVIYRWHDAFDVFVAVLEAQLGDALEMPVASHLCDLHLIYQLQGSASFRSVENAAHASLSLSAGQRAEVYAPPSKGLLCLSPPHAELAVVVPKRNWLTRHPPRTATPMEQVIADLRDLRSRHRHLLPAPITPEMHAWLHLLLSMPAYPGMLMDDALNGPVAQLIEAHRAEYLREERESAAQYLVESARLLARELVQRMDGGQPPTADGIAAALHTTARRIREQHYRLHKQRFVHYIYSCRMEEAQQRLRAGAPIVAAAYQLGWSEHTNFTAQFRKYTGLTPSEYRKRHAP